MQLRVWMHACLNACMHVINVDNACSECRHPCMSECMHACLNVCLYMHSFNDMNLYMQAGLNACMTCMHECVSWMNECMHAYCQTSVYVMNACMHAYLNSGIKLTCLKINLILKLTLSASYSVIINGDEHFNGSCCGTFSTSGFQRFRSDHATGRNSALDHVILQHSPQLALVAFEQLELTFRQLCFENTPITL